MGRVLRPCIYSGSVTSRRVGWWGVAFVATLFVGAAMVSVPTATQGGREIQAFYVAHAGVIVVQQVLGVVALGARRRRFLLAGTVLLAVTELATNILPAILAVANLEPDGAHGLTVLEDLADAALSISIGVFAIAATIDQVGWVRAVGGLVAALSLLRGVMTPLGVRALDVLAPVSFLALVLILSFRLLMGRSGPTSTGAAQA